MCDHVLEDRDGKRTPSQAPQKGPEPRQGRHRLALHHIPFAEQAPHTSQNPVTLCDRHHRIHHEGHLAIEGDGDRSIKVTWPQSFRSIRTGAASRTMSTATPHWLAPTGSSRKKAAV